MNDFLKWLGKLVLHGVLWVFVLSITWNGRPIFFYANDVLIQNALVEAADEELADLWFRLKETAAVTFSDSEPDEERAM